MPTDRLLPSLRGVGSITADPPRSVPASVMPQLEFPVGRHCLCHQRNVDDSNDLPMNCNGCRFCVWCWTSESSTVFCTVEFDCLGDRSAAVGEDFTGLLLEDNPLGRAYLLANTAWAESVNEHRGCVALVNTSTSGRLRMFTALIMRHVCAHGDRQGLVPTLLEQHFRARELTERCDVERSGFSAGENLQEQLFRCTEL